MPRYAFTVVIGQDAPSEPYLRSLADADEAWEMARAMVAELLAASGDTRLVTAVMMVTDEADDVVFELPFAEVLAAPGHPAGYRS
ncbi:DUF6894 family protein [Methylobacterium nigriterrae]|uniref:DUF6894 family protein n=1 Tax=Methylobacterium nigriterrae TaxID=3127512 RepID=UPI003013BE1C